MAINPSTKYPTLVTPPDADYPYGSSKNESGPGANDGTPYEKARADDIFGFQQAILTEAGIVPSGNAETINASDYLDGLKKILRSSFIEGLTLSNAADADHDITIDVGNAMDSANDFILKLTATLTKQIDVAWAAGDTLGGLFSGTVAIDTWYHVFLIRKDLDGSIDAGFDTSVTAANIPAGYTAFRRVGSVLTDGSANIIGFIQTGDKFIWKTAIQDYVASVVGTSGASLVVSAPLGVVTTVRLVHRMDNSTSVDSLLSQLNMVDVLPSGASVTCHSDINGVVAINHAEIDTDVSSSIRRRSTVGTVSTYLIGTVSYIDRRGA